MAARLPQIDNGLRRFPDDPHANSIRIDSATWQAWLDCPGADGFLYQSPTGSFTAYRHAQSVQWAAYRASPQAVHVVELGDAGKLTLAVLEHAAGALAQQCTAAAQAEAPEPLLASKLYAPRPSAAVVRGQRLVAQLAGGSARPLTVITAPAGFGKTTLITSWAAEQPSARLAWISLEAADSDLRRFLRYVIAACRQIEPMCGALALEHLRGHPWASRGPHTGRTPE